MDPLPKRTASCTVAQANQVLDVHHQPGNVYDSNGADAFIERCVRTVPST